VGQFLNQGSTCLHPLRPFSVPWAKPKGGEGAPIEVPLFGFRARQINTINRWINCT